MLKRRILMALWLLPLGMSGQTVSGTVSDVRTGETLIGATVMETATGKGTVTNAQGRFTLTPGVRQATVRVSYIGYTPQIFEVGLQKDTTLSVKLEPSVELREVTVSAEREGLAKASQMSAVVLPVEQLQRVPVMFGEADILKAIQLLPGVQSGGEGASGIYVRGGGPDENLFLLDGIPLYNVNHLGGFFSAFNSNAVKNVTLYKGSFPARFSGRISSVLDIATNNGNDQEWHGSASIGAIAANVSVEGPIVREKTTLSASLRRTWLDLLMKPFVAMSADEMGGRLNLGYYFYDLNAKVTHRFSERSRLYGSLYLGDDVVYMGVNTSSENYSAYRRTTTLDMGYNWGNLMAALRWNYSLSPRLFMNLTASYTRYRNNLEMTIGENSVSDSGYWESKAEADYNSGIRDFSLRCDFDYAPNPDHAVRFGGTLTHHLFSPEVMGGKMSIDASDTSYRMTQEIGGSRLRAQEVALYAEDDWSFTDALKVNVGVVVGEFLVEGKLHPSVQPRLSGRMMLTDALSLKAGYAYMTQYLHLLSSSNISLPTDLWVPVTSHLSPMTSSQVAAGVAYSRWGIDFSVEGYYKWMDNLMEYRPGSNFFGVSEGWENKVTLGRGRAYGIEFLAHKTVGRLTGWVGYTWSRTLRTFDDLNDGREFPAKYDRIHDLSITLQYRHSERFDCGVTWVFATGNTATLALQEYEGGEEEGTGFATYGYVSERNNFRLPAYHRMDVSANFHKQLKHGVRTWSISVYNLYNHQNPYVVYVRHISSYIGVNSLAHSAELVQLSLFPIIPTVSYIYKF